MSLCLRFVSAAIVACLLGIFPANADVYTYQVTVTNAQSVAYSDPLPLSGYLDKIEVINEAVATGSVVVASYSTSTNAVDTYATKTITNTAGTVFRTRVIGTTSAAVDLAAVAAGANTNQSTILVATYEKPMIGSLVRVAVTGTCNDGSNTYTVRIFTSANP